MKIQRKAVSGPASDTEQALRFFLLKAAVFVAIPLVAAAIAAATVLLR